MDALVNSLLIYVILPTILAIGAWLMKSHVERISRLEVDVQLKTTEAEVRTILADKLDPIREDIKELKANSDRILDILLRKN